MEDVLEILTTVLIIGAVFGLPALSVSFFTVSLVKYKRTDKDAPEKQSRRTRLIISSIIMGVLLSAFVTLVILFSISITHM